MPIRKNRQVGQSERFAVRDNTRTRFVPEHGFISDIDHENRPVGVDITDNPMGWMPVAGDILQAGQAALDFGNRKYGKALLNAGLLLVPNVAEKPVKQLLKSGATRVLRHAPTQEINLMDARMRPYKGQNFVMHGVDHGDIVDVLAGETRAMSPSLAVNRLGDANVVPDNLGFYGDHHFNGDRSWLENGMLFRGDAKTPSVGEVYGVMERVPSNERATVANELWRRTQEDLNESELRIGQNALNYLDTPGAGYFEAKYKGLLPLESAHHALFPEPGAVGTILDPHTQEAVIRGFERLGLPVTTYNGYDDKIEKLYNLLVQHPEWRFKSGGKIHIDPSKKGTFTAAAKKHGKSVQAFASQVLAHPENYSPAMRKKANFARNSAKWHGDGGLIERYGADAVRAALVKMGKI